MSCCFKFLGELEGFQITMARVERSLWAALCFGRAICSISPDLFCFDCS
jgi:hypothetical protein